MEMSGCSDLIKKLLNFTMLGLNTSYYYFYHPHLMKVYVR